MVHRARTYWTASCSMRVPASPWSVLWRRPVRPTDARLPSFRPLRPHVPVQPRTTRQHAVCIIQQRGLYNDAVWEGTRHGSSLRGRARDTAAVCEGGLSRRSRSRNAARLVKETVETLENVAGARLNGCHNVKECGAFGPGNR